MSDETIDKIKADESIEAIRFPASDVYHYSRGKEPICGVNTGSKYRDPSPSEIDIETAEELFTVCTTCEKTYHPDVGFTTSELLTRIREEIESAGNSGHFEPAELHEIYKEVKND